MSNLPTAFCEASENGEHEMKISRRVGILFCARCRHTGANIEAGQALAIAAATKTSTPLLSELLADVNVMGGDEIRELPQRTLAAMLAELMKGTARIADYMVELKLTARVSDRELGDALEALERLAAAKK